MDLVSFRKLTRIEQTFFGLPFILSGAVLACIEKKNWSLDLSFFWILAAFLFARISGMAFNQLIDRKIDARNPRTKTRIVACGKVSTKEAFVVAICSLILFLFSCKMLSTQMFLFSLPAGCLIVIYSYCKRFTFLAHFVLGAIHFSAPLLTGLALNPECSLQLFFLSCSSFFLFAGSDILYAFLDLSFDKEQKLYSLPAIVGIRVALRTSEICHIFSILSLFAVGFFTQLKPFFYLSPLIAMVAFFSFHNQVKNVVLYKESKPKIETLFFSTNVIVATSTLLFLILGAL